MLISIIVTVRNEEKNIRDLLDSLVIQEPPIEILIVDSGSEDQTVKIVNDYISKYDFVKLYKCASSRGASRNYGSKQAKGEIIAFIDGDCIANPFWIHEIRKMLNSADADIVGGKTINLGYQPFVELGRVELFHEGYDVTLPSCNLAYKKSVFESIGGFDPEFVTAEDIDLNYRAVSSNYKIVYNPNMIVYHRMRSTFVGFFIQAFWNGFGRKQLTRKHGKLWTKYKPVEMLRQHYTFWYFIRLIVAMLGYLTCKFLYHPHKK